MSALQSNSEALFIMIPMVILLLAGMFRIDELLSRPRRRVATRYPLMAGLDRNGQPSCIDPDGTCYSRSPQK